MKCGRSSLALLEFSGEKESLLSTQFSHFLFPSNSILINLWLRAKGFPVLGDSFFILFNLSYCNISHTQLVPAPASNGSLTLSMSAPLAAHITVRGIKSIEKLGKKEHKFSKVSPNFPLFFFCHFFCCCCWYSPRPAHTTPRGAAKPGRH